MTKNYKQLSEKIKNRLNPENISIKKAFSEELGTISYSHILVFIRTAMKGVEPEYTKKSKDAGERVKTHLNTVLTDKTYKYQGSVMTNTHIKGASDIDLLVISEKFYSYDLKRINNILSDPNQKSQYYNSSIQKLEKEKSGSNYLGNSIEDLHKLRIDSENVLIPIYDICDISKPKNIKIKNKNLNREVDVVIANWYDDVSSIINDKGEFRGVQVYNKLTKTKGKSDYPFLSIKRINEKNSLTNGRLKKMIRFLKNVKYFSQIDIKLSSFDINAICYEIDISKYKDKSFYQLVPVIYSQLYSLSTNNQHSDDLISVDGREYIFRHDKEKHTEMLSLLKEINDIASDLNKTPIYG
ncbi:nucleotidyltransferase domain-containing protein [Tenacibaculum ovolyticum]|uniref:nucleotidyltransferase domain-containing protein n=1 Tax=Tenacibaculum ovolyticum TaxID=104270 RepID=UPI0007EC7575|nr:nucleotidyltransferase domain-containing protein [Tenacibaculum ovolyticum]